MTKLIQSILKTPNKSYQTKTIIMQCPFCKNIIFSKKLKIQSNILKEFFSYYICDQCHSIIQRPIPNDLEIKKYYEHYINIKEKMNPGYLNKNNLLTFYNERYKTLKEIGFNIESFKNSTNVELGCANGQFLKFMKDNGATNIIGIDISQSMLESINIDKVSLIHGDLTTISSNSVDNLFLFNILEHLPNIETNIFEIKRIMKKNGQIIIEVPLAGFISKRFKENWRFLMPIEHLNIPSLNGLTTLLNTHNIIIINKTRFGSGLTTGTTPFLIKRISDIITKKLSFGDRGTFLCNITNK